MRPMDADEFLSKIDPDEYYHTNEIRAMVADTLAASNDPLTLDELREMDGKPITHGLWNIEYPVDFRVKPWSVSCSICGWSTGSKTDYCPKCGAKMDAETYRHRPEEGTIWQQ